MTFARGSMAGMMITRLLVLAATTATLAACSGGSSSGSASPAGTPTAGKPSPKSSFLFMDGGSFKLVDTGATSATVVVANSSGHVETFSPYLHCVGDGQDVSEGGLVNKVPPHHVRTAKIDLFPNSAGSFSSPPTCEVTKDSAIYAR